MSKKDTIVKPTAEQLAEWKRQYGQIYQIEVAREPDQFEPNTPAPDLEQLEEEKKLTGYLRKPDRKVMNFALVTMPKNIIAAGKAVLKDCWLGGDTELLTHEDYNATASLQAIELVEIYQSRLKKV